MLGYLDPDYFLGGARRLDHEAAVQAIEREIAKPLGTSVVAAAWGIHELVTLNMEGAIRVVSIGRGKDPRQLACVTFGGAGPIHGARLARSLGIRRMIVPFAAGVGSALGLLIADPRFDLVRTLVVRLGEAPWARINALYDDMTREGTAQLGETGIGGEWVVRRTADVRYAGQGHELAVAVPDGPLGPGSLSEIERAHADVYRAHYGYAEAPGVPLEATNWRLEMVTLAPRLELAAGIGATRGSDPRKGQRRVYLPEAGGFADCPVLDRYRLAVGAEVTGPAIVEERETTTLLLPGDRATTDAHGKPHRRSRSDAETMSARPAPAGLDSITRAVVGAAMHSIAEEAGTALRKTAYSMAVREGRDFSVALFDATGQMIAQGDFSPGHLGSMPSIVKHVLAEYPADALQPGDAIVLNDLYMGSGHLPDFFMTTPVFHRGRLVGFVVNCAHQVDVGGAVAGSQAVEGVTEFYQEGLRVLPVALWRAGEVNREVLRLIRGNVRLPDIVEGDLKAMRSAGRVGELRMLELFERYGAETVLGAWTEILDHCEREMRAAIRSVPPGRYAAEDFYDDYGRGTEPLRVFVTIVVEGDEITVDFTGSSPQTPSGINSAFNYTLSYTWHTVKSVLVQSTLPQNAGTMRPIHAVAPEGSLFNPRPPAAAGARAVMQQRIVDVILQALAPALPERVIAASSQWANPIVEGQDRGRRFVYYDIIVGGMGARPHADGAEAVCGSFNLENIPVEVNETDYPILVERLEFVRDSSGAGRFRGCSGLRKDVRFLGDRGSVSNLSDRHRFAAPGLFGGGPGAPCRTVLNPDGEDAKDLHPKAIYPLAHGDLVSFQVSGGGGYGDPLDRDPALVARDVRLGYVSPDRAHQDYGVVLDPATGIVDAPATETLRRRRRGPGA